MSCRHGSSTEPSSNLEAREERSRLDLENVFVSTYKCRSILMDYNAIPGCFPVIHLIQLSILPIFKMHGS